MDLRVAGSSPGPCKVLSNHQKSVTLVGDHCVASGGQAFILNQVLH